MKYAVVDYASAHEIVERNMFLEWDGWDITTRRKSENGFSDKRGVFKNGEWWLQFRYPLRNDGTWKIPEIYVNH
jgi:hypothetical protein